MLLYKISRLICWTFLKIVGKFKVVHGERVPRQGAFILTPNHISNLDPPAVGSSTRRLVHFMAKSELFESRILSAWMTAVGTFSVKRGMPDRKAIKRALDLLEQGEVVCIFPEGTRSEDGKLQEAELGLGMFAMKSRAPIVPLAIIGTNKVLPPREKGLHFHQITMVYGEPLTFPDLYDSKDSRQAYEEIGRRTMAAIADLQASFQTVS